jgi:putative PEP-CTERM system TPR-repeat lipoprotein
MTFRPARSALVIALLCTVLAACNRGPDAKATAAALQQQIDKHEYRAAVIGAKSALQKLPDDAELRRLLGVALLESGDVVAAGVELRKARELGAADARTVPPLARAMLAQRDLKNLLTLFGSQQLDDAAASADLKTTLGTAHAMLGDRAAAQEAATAALREWPRHAGARLLQARMAAANQDVAGANQLVDAVLADEPANVFALMLRGDLQRQAGQDDAALASYRAASAARPDAVAPAAAAVGLLIDKRRLPEAGTELGKLKGFAAQHIDTRLLEARLAYVNKEFAKTRDISAQLLKAMPEHPLLLQMAGDSELRLGNLGPAENYLTTAVKVAPRALAPRLLLAQLQLRAGQGARALEALQPVLASENPDANSLTMAGQAYLQEGDAARAEAMFARAAKVDPANPMARTAMALNKLSKGQADSGFAELEAAAAADTGARADMALIAARLRNRDTAGALKAIEALAAKQPDQPMPHVLRGRVLMSKNDTAGARASLEKALALDPKHFAAIASLAALDLAANQPDAARARLTAAQKADPNNPRLALALAELQQRTGAPPEQVTKQLNDAVRANPSDPAARMALVRHLLQAQDTKAALNAAQEAHAALPGNHEILQQLGTTQLAAGQPQQAVSTFVKLSTALPKRAAPELALAEAHVATQDYAAAARAVDRALEREPKSVPAKLAEARVALLQKQFDKSVRLAKALQSQLPKSPAPLMLEAEAEIARGNHAAAVAPLRAALPLSSSAVTALTLHRTLMTLGQKGEADAVAAAWRKKAPQDPAFSYYLGDMALARKAYAEAEAHYREVLQNQPQNPLALNNVAWLMAQERKPGAVAMAEQANKLMPNQAPLMDTLATALASENQFQKAIDLQKRAVATWPEDHGLKLTLARIYLKAGEKAYARAELEALARLGSRFGAQAEVAELMKATQ